MSARRELPPEHPARRQVEEGSSAARAAMPSVKLPLPLMPALEVSVYGVPQPAESRRKATTEEELT